MEAKIASYDDPYKILAINLVVDSTHGDIVRMLYDDDFIERMVQKETRNIDFYGIFLDCIVEQILIKKQRMVMMHELDKLGSFFFQNLSLLRLRKEITAYLDRYKIEWRSELPTQYQSCADSSIQKNDELSEGSQSQSHRPECASPSS